MWLTANLLLLRIQMEMDNHRNESRANMKAHDIRMEEVAHSALVKISDIRTEIEQAKWDNTRRGVGRSYPVIDDLIDAHHL